MLLLLSLQRFDTSLPRRKAFFFDSFMGLPDASANGEDGVSRGFFNGKLVGTRPDFEALLTEKRLYDRDIVRIREGWFNTTLPAETEVTTISFLRLVRADGVHKHLSPRRARKVRIPSPATARSIEPGVVLVLVRPSVHPHLSSGR